jgi:ribosomal protein L31
MSLYCLKQKICHGMYVGSQDLYKQNDTVKKTIKRVGRQKQADRNVRRLSQRYAWLSLTSQSDLRK